MVQGTKVYIVNMKKITVEMYECEWCGERFFSEKECTAHEKDAHKCPNCIHSFWLYGCERTCELESASKRCSFKLRPVKEYTDNE